MREVEDDWDFREALRSLVVPRILLLALTEEDLRAKGEEDLDTMVVPPTTELSESSMRPLLLLFSVLSLLWGREGRHKQPDSPKGLIMHPLPKLVGLAPERQTEEVFC